MQNQISHNATANHSNKMNAELRTILVHRHCIWISSLLTAAQQWRKWQTNWFGMYNVHVWETRLLIISEALPSQTNIENSLWINSHMNYKYRWTLNQLRGLCVQHLWFCRNVRLLVVAAHNLAVGAWQQETIFPPHTHTVTHAHCQMPHDLVITTSFGSLLFAVIRRFTLVSVICI